MKCSAFNIRLQGFSALDQATLNEFLDKVEVKQTFASLVNGLSIFWAILVSYDERPHSQGHARESDLTERKEIIYQNLKKWRES